jgi:hypothetical protein
VLAETVPHTAKATPAGGGDGLPPEWQAIRELALEGAERSFVEGLARFRSIPVPVVGYETDAGIPIDFAWPDVHLAVRLDVHPVVSVLLARSRRWVADHQSPIISRQLN